MPTEAYTMHWSCLQNGVHKPSDYKSEAEMFEEMASIALSCTRYWHLSVWYPMFVKVGVVWLEWGVGV